MEIVSHRGNLNGASDNENHPDQILKTLNDFRVEVDVWFIDGKWFLGHDNPDYPIAIDFFHKNMFYPIYGQKRGKNAIFTPLLKLEGN